MDRFPELPAHVPHEQLAGLTIEAHPPGVAEAVGPHLRPSPRHPDEGIIPGDGVVLARVLVIDVDPQDGGEQVGDVLPRVERVGRVRVRRVPRGDVQHPVGAEVEITAVVTSLQVGDDDLLARRVDAWRIGRGDPEPRHARAVGEVHLVGVRSPQGIADEALAVPFEVRMKGQPVHRLDLLRPREQGDRPDLPGQIQEPLGPGIGSVSIEGIQDARLLADDEPIAPGDAGDEQGMLELQVGERADDLEGRGRVGRAHDAGGRPGLPARPDLPGLACIVRGRAAPGREYRHGNE